MISYDIEHMLADFRLSKKHHCLTPEKSHTFFPGNKHRNELICGGIMNRTVIKKVFTELLNLFDNNIGKMTTLFSRLLKSDIYQVCLIENTTELYWNNLILSCNQEIKNFKDEGKFDYNIINTMITCWRIAEGFCYKAKEK